MVAQPGGKKGFAEDSLRLLSSGLFLRMLLFNPLCARQRPEPEQGHNAAEEVHKKYKLHLVGVCALLPRIKNLPQPEPEHSSDRELRGMKLCL